MHKEHLSQSTTILLQLAEKSKLFLANMAKVPLKIMLVVVVEAVHITGDISCCQGSICWQL